MSGGPGSWVPQGFGANSIKDDEGPIHMGSLDAFQASEANNLTHGHVYPGHPGHPGHPSNAVNQFGLQGQFPATNLQSHGQYYGNTQGFVGANTNGGGLHGHGHGHGQGQFEQSYNTPYNISTGYESGFSNGEAHNQFVTEQPGRTHGHTPSHTPNNFGSQQWQGPQMQFQSEFNLEPISYGHRNNEHTYAQQQPQVQQNQQMNTYPGNSFFNQEVFGAQNGSNIRSQQSEPSFQSYQSYPGHQTGGATLGQFQHGAGVGAGAGTGAGAGVQKTADQVYLQPQQVQSLLPSNVQAPQEGTRATPVVESPREAEPTTELTIEPDNSWVRPDGCPFLLVKNPPPTNLGKFCDVKLRNGDKPYIAKYDTRAVRLLPNRQTRLPSEIQAEIDALTKEQTDARQPEKDKLQGQINILQNEPLLISGADEPAPASNPPIKVKSGSKRQPSNMDPASKPGSSGNLPAEEESATDVTARTIKSSGRPNDTLKAVEYDIIDILWRDPKQPEFSQKLIAEKIHAFGDYFVELLQKSKDLKGKLDDAKKNDPAKVDSLKADLDNVYDSIRAGIEAALKFGDAFTISQLSIHLKFLANLAVLLRTLFVADDYNGRLPKAILKLFSLFVTVDMDILKERLKFDRLRQKIKDNLDEESLDYMDEIFENAKKRSALKTEEAREGAKKASQGSTKKSSSLGTKDPVSAPPRLLPSKSDALSKKNSAEIKRPIDYSSLSSARKLPSTTTKASPSLSTSKRPGDDGVDSRASKKLAVENAAGAPSTTKTSSSGTSAASQSSPANVQSRSRPSGSMLPGRLRLSAKAQPKKPVARQPASSTIGGLLAEINSEEKPKQAKEPERAPETPEETQRRLRKEARRKLHVTWKPDDELTEIRFLEHDTAEDKGRDDNMLRDARDNRSEGLALRESIKREKQGVDEEDEETREKAKDITLKNWHEPDPYSPHEKSHISQKRREEMFASRGGMRPVESRQNKVMEDYESRELMSIYTSFTEIPETPRSPTGRVAEIVPQPKIRTLPSEPTRWNEFLPATSTKHAEIQHRWSDQLNYGGETARVNALHRINSLAGSMNPPNAMSTSGGRDASSGRDDAAEVLALLQSDKVKNFVDPDPFDPAHPKTHRRHDYGDPKVQADIDALEDTFAVFISNQQPPNQPPVHQAQPSQPYQQPAQVQQQLPPEYLEALQKINALSAAQAFQPSVQPTQATVAPSPQINQQSLFAALGQPSAPPAQPTQPAGSMQGLQGILDALKTASTPAYSQAHTTANAGNNAASYNGHQNYWPDWPQNQMQSQTQPQTSQGYAGYGHNNQSFGGQPQHNQGQAAPSQHDSNERGNRRDFRGNREQKSINRSLIGTKACSFWAKGQCAKGSNCTFRHDPNDLQSQNQDSAHGYHP